MSYQPDSLIVADWVQSNWVYNCTIVASAALAFYDYFTTFGREVELIWGRKFSSVTLLFHANRWSNIAWAIVNLMQLNLGSPMYESMLLQHIQARFQCFTILVAYMTILLPPSCLGLGLMSPILDVVRYTLWAAFSGIRVYAISRGSWALTALVTLLSLLPAGMTAYSDFGEWTDSIADIPVIGVWCLPSAKITTRALTTTNLHACKAFACVEIEQILPLGFGISRVESQAKQGRTCLFMHPEQISRNSGSLRIGRPISVKPHGPRAVQRAVNDSSSMILLLYIAQRELVDRSTRDQTSLVHSDDQYNTVETPQPKSLTGAPPPTTLCPLCCRKEFLLGQNMRICHGTSRRE